MPAWTLVTLMFLFLSIAPAETVRYVYDDAGRLARVEYGGGKTITYAYDKSGNLLKRVIEGGPPAGASSNQRPRQTKSPARRSRR